jgi:predicted O-methyltransferase YrrM
LREGDLRETLVDVSAPIDFMLIDIWTPMARPALELIAPRLREGAVVICDNTVQFRDAYRGYFEFINDPANGLRTMTLPFEGGLEFTVRGG